MNYLEDSDEYIQFCFQEVTDPKSNICFTIDWVIISMGSEYSYARK